MISGSVNAGRAAKLGPVAQEGGDRLVPLVLERLGRHRQQGVVGQEGDDLVDFSALDGGGKARNERALAR